MTRVEVFIVICGWCGSKIEAPLYHSINVTLNPELKGKLFNEEINVIQCDKCGRFTHYDIPILYHDMKDKLLVYYFPEDDEDVEKLGKEKVKENVLKIAENFLKEGYTVEVTIGWEEFTKAVLWRNY